MTLTTAPSARRFPAAAMPASALGVTAILAAAAAWHVQAYPNTDVAWLLTVAEHVADGARPYADIVETNPPSAVLLHVPAVLIGRLFGIEPQAIMMLLVTLACAGVLALCCAILRRSCDAWRGASGTVLGAAAAVLVLLPAGSFGEREHIILLTTLPLLCCLAERATGAERGRTWFGVLAGLGAGFGLSIKPYYVLGFAGPALLVLSRIGWRGLLGAWELWLAALAAATLAAVQLAAFPAFTHEILPLAARIYMPAKLPFWDLLMNPSSGLGVAALVGFWLVRRGSADLPPSRRTIADAAALASAGFFVAYLLQGKGWAYHVYPALATSLIALVLLLAGPRDTPSGRRTGLGAYRLAAAILAGVATLWLDVHLDIDAQAPGLAAALETLAPHPSLMSLSSDVAIGHPLVRRVHGRWVGTLMSSWIHRCIDRVAPRSGPDGPFGQDLAFEDHTMASDIRNKRPDAVLATAPGWPAWIESEPATGEALDDYRLAGTFGSVMLWTRKPGR